MMMRKLFTAALGTTLLATSLVGCGSSTTQKTTDANGDQVELTIWVTSRNQDDWSASMEKKFLEEHPNIKLNKVVKEGDPGNEFYQGVAAGTAPDIVKASFTVTNSYIAEGILEPLNAYTDKWDEWQHFTKDYTDMFTKDGNIYAVPTQVSPMLFGYNKALFKEAGIKEAPKTWEDALSAAKKISGLSEQTTGYATLAAEWTEWFFQYYVWQAGGDLTKQNEDGTATLTFTDPAVIKAAKYYQELKKEGVIQSDLTLKFTDLVTNFGLGKVGMMPFASDWVSEAITNGIDPDDIGLTLPPVAPGGQPVTAIGGENWIVNAKSDKAKKDAAWEYIKFYTSKDYFSAYFENLATKGAPNPIIVPRSDINITDFYEFPEEYAEVLENVKSIGRLEFYGKGDFGSYVDRAVQKILADPSADPEKVFAEAQALCEKEALGKFNETNKK